MGEEYLHQNPEMANQVRINEAKAKQNYENVFQIGDDDEEDDRE